MEALFGLKKRQALHLMHRIGAVRVSRELALDQRDLLRWLEQQLADPSAQAEWRHHERVIERLVELKAETAARAVKITLPERVPTTEFPPGVSLAPGLLTVAFQTSEELLERLFLLARVLPPNPIGCTTSPSRASLSPGLAQRLFQRANHLLDTLVASEELDTPGKGTC